MKLSLESMNIIFLAEKRHTMYCILLPPKYLAMLSSFSSTLSFKVSEYETVCI